jgi:flagellar biosynthesis/type III secretory pathway chaperone
MMNDQTSVRDLTARLAELHAALTQLTELATDKLAALSRADAPGLQSCAAREEEILREVFRSEPRRKAALARVAHSLPGSAPAPLRLKDIAGRLPEPLASSLRARSTALQARAAELQRKNRLAGRVAQNLQAHIRGIFADVAAAAQESLVYGPQGQHETGRPRCWVDAVG